MNDRRDPETEAQIRRALGARAEETAVDPNALDSIRDRRSVSAWARPATYAAVAAAVAVIAGVAVLTRPNDDAGLIDTAVTTSTTLPEYPTVTRPDPYPTTAPLDTTPTAFPADDVGNGPSPADQARAGLVIWPTDGVGADSADAAAQGWLENVLGVSAEHGVERPPAESPGDSTRFIIPMIGEDGQPRDDVEGVHIWVGSPDGSDWFVTEAGSANPRIDLVEYNGSATSLRITGFGDAFEGTGLLWIDDVGPKIVGLGNGSGDEFSVIVPWDGDGPVRVRLETGESLEGAVPGVHAFAVDPEPASTDIIVVHVELDDVLNVRAAAGVSNEIVFALDPFARAITHTGRTERVDGAEWWEVLTLEGEVGWANARFLSVRPAVDPDSPLADEMIVEAARFLRAFAPDANPAVSDSLPHQHPHGTEIGGIGVFADAPTPFVTIDDLWAESVDVDWDPFPEEAGDPCGDHCLRSVEEFLDVRARDLADAEYSIGVDLADLQPNIRFHTGHTENYYDRFATVVAYVPAESDDVLDWRRITFAYDFIDGSPTISQVWLWGWTP